MSKKLVIVLGPTGVGKTELTLQLAERLNTEIISCDSRQMFKEMSIGTARPTEAQTKRVKHHFVGNLSIHNYYSCGRFELEVLELLKELFKTKDTVIMTGGSMLYIDAICKGIDDRPEVNQELRDSLWARYDKEGIDGIREELVKLDPDYAAQMDPHNYKRIIHALEICLSTGQPYSKLRQETKKERDFEIVKIGLNLPREELYDRINKRVDQMMEEGLLEEAKSLYPQRELNSLNTVGYKELFNYFDGTWDYDYAVSMIKQDSRRYAKKQLTWFRRDEEIHWIAPTDIEEAVKISTNG
ncbi:MAG: tRNA (adenosine(37)-N6)-dimethylallyltransferase MiaA [Paludibacteraceae bacterium]|nr:tRNA (adenosine(37)-N6)-dimethylallyltransferase MiaA [Paludibacteraceae bacterium]